VSHAYRLKLSRPSLKLRVATRIPAQLVAENFLTITKANGVYTFDVDYELLDTAAFSDPTTTYVAVLDTVSDSYKITTLSALIAGTTGIEQHITAAGPVAINANTGIARVDQTVGAAITLTLPAAVSKTCPVLIADWKGDAGTNNITITPAGAETIQGLSSWTIGGDGGSIFLRPISGVGYVI
jgi:phage tail protein X